jgi:hypothetical protein
MNKKWYNLPRITAVFLLLITLTSTIYLYQFAPARANNIGNATIRTQDTTHLVLNGNQFNCTNPDNDARTLSCSVMLEGRKLAMELTTTQGAGSTIRDCAASFGGRSVTCQGNYSMRYRGPIVIVQETLGISQERFEQLRRTHWLDQVSETVWLRLTLVFVLLLALNGAALLWQWLSEKEMKRQWQTAVTIMGSLAVFFVLRISSTLLLLFQGWID